MVRIDLTLTPLVFGFAFCLTAGSVRAADYPVAGLAPDRRPAEAPTITEFRQDEAWRNRALTGISEPYPASLEWLDDQGAWYTPFNRPGMTGPYDLRGWHGAAQGGQ